MSTSSSSDEHYSATHVGGHSHSRQRRRRRSVRRAVKLLTAATMCTAFALLFGLTVTATVVGLVVATPLLVIFSPVLVPAVLAAAVVGAGFLVSGGCGMAAAGALVWVYAYVTGRRPPGTERLEGYYGSWPAPKDKALDGYVDRHDDATTNHLPPAGAD
ncbi:unnamed protein product [Linum tenue]|uniref:Oleosin n=2 Tax=Linum tenue TaxID=586396 RepID=A0AAV0JF26_9ROSI|nr:unnamed protein product [Linum tenue]